MIVDGKAIAEDILLALERERADLPRAPRLGVVMGVGDAATESFVRIKTRVARRLGVVLAREELSIQADTAQALEAVRKLSVQCDGVIIQLPLPPGIDTEAVLEALSPEADVDGTGKNPRVLPPVVGAVREIFSRHGVGLFGKRALVVGQGRLVGMPVARWLREQGAAVAVVTRSEGLRSAARGADIVVLGAGSGGILKPDMIARGVVVIDAGASELEGELRGDADPACAEKAAIFTPVPGGVGPIAVAMIFRNLFTLLRK